MTPQLVLLKVRLRLNKLHSQDYDNIEDWKVMEAVNKAQLEWYRRQVVGYNKRQDSAEQDRVSVDDLQQFLVDKKITGANKHGYFLSNTLPTDYLWFNKVIPLCKKGECQGVPIESDLVEEANVPSYLFDWASQPSFEWRETFHTIVGGKIKVYTKDEFDVENLLLTYFRQPRKVDVIGYTHEDSTPSINSDLEFKDDVAELILDDAAAILAADVEYYNASQVTKGRSDTNS